MSPMTPTETKMKRATSVLLSILLLSGSLAVSLGPQPILAGGTVFIRADGSIDPPTTPISTADGSIYALTADIYDPLVVERDGIVIDGDGRTLRGAGGGTGISLSGRARITIKNILIRGFQTGIRLDSSSHNNISGSNIVHNGYGIVLAQNSGLNIIRGNNIEGNTIAGIMIDSSSHNTICYNSFVGNAQQATTIVSTNVWHDDYPIGGNYWSEYAGSDDKVGPGQDLPGSDGIGDMPYSIDSGNRDQYPLTTPAPVREWAYAVRRTFPLNIVFVGFEDAAVDTGTIDTNLNKQYQFRYGHYDLVYGFDVTYHLADSSYYQDLRTFVLANSVLDTTSALDVAALELQKATGTRMSIFADQPGRAIDALAVEEWLVANPYQAASEPGYWFYVMNFTELDSGDAGLKHWYAVDEWDFEADRLRDFWRLEWDNALNPDVGFPYACFTSQSRVLFIDPSAHQWYLRWAKTWWGLPVGGPKYEYYEFDLAKFLTSYDVDTSPGRTALAHYLAGWIEDGLANLLAPDLYPDSDVLEAKSVSLQALVLNNAADLGYDNETVSWIANSTLYEQAIADLAPWLDVDVMVTFDYLGDHPRLQAIFDGAVVERKDGWTYYDGMKIWQQLHDARESYFDFTAADLVINAYVYLETDMSMRVYGGEYTGLGGSGQILVMQELGRYFEEDGITPKSGLGKTFVHEAGHNFGFPHTFTTTAYAGDFAFDVMGYYPHSYFFTQLRKDSFRRLVVDARLMALQEELDKLSMVRDRGTSNATIDAAFSQVHLDTGEVLPLYEELQFLEAYSEVAQAEESLLHLECLLQEHLITPHPETPDTDPLPPEDSASRRCFIATAAYGTSMAEEVQVLRQLRDECLLTTTTGRALVDLYYRISPPLADFLSEHPRLKPVVRATLFPVVMISALAIPVAPPEPPVRPG
jgi:parallel beta-helix repeat protein